MVRRALMLSLLALAACARTPERRVVVIGIDGAEWRVVRQMWDRGKLPNLKALASRGIAAELRTDYGRSPVIWTTIATGREPRDHGITDFVDAVGGKVPVSSSMRKVPALWNMTTVLGIKTAVLGWWVTWPAEDIHGAVLSDRVGVSQDKVASPPEFEKHVYETRDTALSEHVRLMGATAVSDPWIKDGAMRDQMVAYHARHMVSQDYPLVLAYFRTVDIVSHRYWKYYEPEKYTAVPTAEIARFASAIPEVYEATDEAIGSILAATPAAADVLVVSDHGFFAGPEEAFVLLDMEKLLVRLGHLKLRDGAVDFSATTFYPFESPPHAQEKHLRLALRGREPGGTVDPARQEEMVRALERELYAITYESGEPVFEGNSRGIPPGVSLSVRVRLRSPSLKIRIGGNLEDGFIGYINSISGSHTEKTHGVFIAAGPRIDTKADIEGISVDDICPTVLYLLGAPVAKDFAGKAWDVLASADYRRDHPVRTIDSWGSRSATGPVPAAEDPKLIEQLKSLGYLR